MSLLSIFVIIIGFLICFLYWSVYRPTSLWSGFFFICLTVFTYSIIVVRTEEFNFKVAVYIAIPALIVLTIISFFGIAGGVIGLFWNERILVKREGLSLPNLLPLFFALGLLLFEIASLILSHYVSHIWLKLLSSLLTVYFIYVIAIFFFYFVTSILYNHYPFLGKVDYIIVLGAGLIDGERVTPLLAGRIEAAIRLYKKQEKKYQQGPALILSGGKGSDEKLSEAQAMFNYIEEKGYHISKIYKEEDSSTTKENLRFSEKVIDQNDETYGLENKNIVVASSNYHTLRAGKIARSIGLLVRAVGAKTKAYYYPTAFIREYIAYLSMTKKMHILFFSTVFILFVLVGFGLYMF